jgi:scyllo-inositol 2-dehydrogenase (NAD+)
MTGVRVGVVGLGRMGRVYATHLARGVEQAELVAVADTDPAAASAFAGTLGGVATYSDHRGLLGHRGLDAVIVTTPTAAHRETVIDAAAAGKAIFCEKPPALTLHATDEMIEAAGQAGVLFHVGFMRRFDAGFAEARRRIEAGVIGRPVGIRSVGRDPHRTSLEYARPEASGGLIVDMGIHDFDIARWLVGDEVERVYAESASLVYPELLEVGDVDTALVSLHFTGGALGSVEVSRTAAYGYDVRCEVIGSRGALQVGYLRQTPVLTLTREGVSHDVVPHFPERFGAAYVRQIEHFVECVRSGGQPAVSPRDARAALEIALAATVSERERRPVRVAGME